MDGLQKELAEEEEIITSTRNLSQSLDIEKLTLLQKLEDKKLLSLVSRLKAFISILASSLWYRKGFYSEFEDIVLNLEPNDCSLTAKYSRIEEFDDVLLNTISIPHPLRVHLARSQKIENLKLDEILAKIDATPLVVMIHGLGGQSSQFEPLIAILSQCADVFTLDLPGFGNSSSKEKIGLSLTQHTDLERNRIHSNISSLRDDFFSTDQLVSTLSRIINLKRQDRKIILIGHSMGTHLCLKIINELPELTIESLILLSPPKIEASLTKKKLGFMSKIPWLFDILRIYDRIGGLNSHSVARQVFGQDYFKKLRQLRWNLDVDSSMVLKYIIGFKACTTKEMLTAVSKINYTGDNQKRILILCGENDKVTPKLSAIAISDSISEFNPTLEILNNCGHSILLNKPETVSGLVSQFIESISNLNINTAWCLQIKALISGDKWGLKNELKWQKLTCISNSITNPVTGQVAPLVSMKTLRESDPVHNPITFEKTHPNVVAIVDISSDLPSYNPKNFHRIKYHKMPTASKVLPDSANIRDFISLIDEIIQKTDTGVVAVHCHYGYNRTGFLICCYLIEKMGWGVDEAISAFKIAREPGIKHPHFIDGIYVRYK